MGYKTEINYILKSSNEDESLLMQRSEPSDIISVKKSGFRTFVLNSPIMFADNNWNILGFCKIIESVVSENETKLKAIVLTKLSEEEKQTVSRVVQDAEKRK